jgi:hypothetical protein
MCVCIGPGLLPSARMAMRSVLAPNRMVNRPRILPSVNAVDRPLNPKSRQWNPGMVRSI